MQLMEHAAYAALRLTLKILGVFQRGDIIDPPIDKGEIQFTLLPHFLDIYVIFKFLLERNGSWIFLHQNCM